MKSLASCSLSAHQHRLLRHTKTGRESFRFVHMFSTKLVSEYVSFDKDGQIFYSFNYAPFFETMFKENLHKKKSITTLFRSSCVNKKIPNMGSFFLCEVFLLFSHIECSKCEVFLFNSHILYDITLSLLTNVIIRSNERTITRID